jgi:hypothetical protein
MKKHHWIAAFVLLALGYFAGVAWPSWGDKVKAKISGAAA